MDGKVIIGTELSTTQLEKDLNKSKKELEKFEREEENLLTKKQKLEIDVTKSKNALQSLDDKLAIVNQRIADMKEANLSKNLETNVDYQKLLAQYNAIDSKAQEYYQALELQKGQITQINSKLKDNALIQNELNATISSTSKKIEDFVPPEPSKWGEIEGKISGINNNLSQTVKKVAHWGLAIFGIRTAYDAVRGAMSTLSQYDTQMADNIEYIRYALASTLQPVIQTILNLVVRLLQYINYIAKVWTGKNLFKTADAFKSAQKSASGVAQSAKEINKQLAGFDEMNVLSDTSSSGAGGGGADIAAPNIELSQESLFAGWSLEDFIEKGKEIAKNLADGINDFFKNFDFVGFAEGLSKGIRGIIQTITTFIDEVDWQQVGQKITEFLINIDWAGIAVDIINLLVSGLLAIGDFMIGVLDAIIDAVKDPNFLSNMMEAGKNLILGLINGMISIIKKIGEVIKKIIELVLELFGIHSPSTVFADMGVNLILGLINGIKSIINKVVEIFSGLWDKIKNGASKAVQGIKNIFNSIVSFFSGIVNTILGFFRRIGSSVGDVISSAFKGVVNGVLGAIESILNSPIRAVNRLIGVINKVPGINLGTLSTFKLPRLAKGGIINQPGRGIPVGYGQAIAGERRAEGVIPLTDSQQMQLLGESIGRYVTINASITNTMNGRVISRELQKVNNTNNFAFNS